MDEKTKEMQQQIGRQAEHPGAAQEGESAAAANGSPAPPLEKLSEKETPEQSNDGDNPDEVFLQEAPALLVAARRDVLGISGEATKALVDAIVEGITLNPLADKINNIRGDLSTHGRILTRLGPTLDLIEQKFNCLEQSSATLVDIKREHRSLVERLESIDQKFTGIGRAIEVLTRSIQKTAVGDGQGG